VTFPAFVSRGERGASLVEILVATLIFSFFVVGFARSTMNSRRTGDASRFESEATILALDKLEQLRMLLPTHADLTDGAHVDTVNPLHPHGASGGIYSRSWQVTSNLPMLGMKRVEMRVSWPSQLGARSVLLVTTMGYL
jgi:Tfp pilus assembly protein PilV